MMRKCHLNTCPVGVATQDPELRKRFTGDAEHVVNFFKFITEELSEIMAELGFRTVEEMVGQVDVLKQNMVLTIGNTASLIYHRFYTNNLLMLQPVYTIQEEQDHGLQDVLDWKLLEAAQPAILNGEKVRASFGIRNTDRTAGTITYQTKSLRNTNQLAYLPILFILALMELPAKASVPLIPMVLPLNWKVMQMTTLVKDFRVLS
jgi:glutamate synthase (NADPH/NADH) large chain